MTDRFKTWRVPYEGNKLNLLKKIYRDPILKNSLTNDFKNLFDLLGFNLQAEYKYAIINTQDWDYEWRTTKKQNCQEIFFHRKQSSKYIELIDKKYSLDDHILRHIFPFELKNKIYKKNLVYDIQEQINANYIKKDMCSGYFKNYSDVIAIDIDCHNNNPHEAYLTAFKIINHFKKFLYLERSYQGGYHLYIKLDKVYNFESRKEYINKLKNLYDIKNIEVPNTLRFPFSFHYESLEDLDSSESIQPLTAKKIIIKNYKNQLGFTIPEINSDAKQIVIPKNNVIQFNSKLYDRERKSKNKIKHITPEEFLSQPDIFISEGNRWLPMIKLCAKGKFNGWTYEQCKMVIKQIDYGSRDLKKWSDTRLLKEIEGLYKSSTIYYQESLLGKPNNFISNIDKIPEAILEAILNKEFINKIILNCNYKLTELNQQKFKVILSEMIGYIYYDSINNRTTLNNKSNKYIVGKQFSSQYANLMSEFYSDKFNCIDCHSIIKSILKYSQLFSQYKINSRGWYFNHLDNSNNFCKQYDFINNSNHYLFNNFNIISYLIIKLINNNIINQFIIQDFFINNNIINEYLIEENNIYLQNTG